MGVQLYLLKLFFPTKHHCSTELINSTELNMNDGIMIKNIIPPTFPISQGSNMMKQS